MRIALFSDLHLEFMHYELWQPPALDVDLVILAGDIDKHDKGIEWARIAFPDTRIIYVSGNHELYNGSVRGDLAQMRRTAARAGIDFLENDTVVIDGVRFLGAIGWSDFALYGEGECQAIAMNAAQRSINDYRLIRGSDGHPLEPRETARLHRETVAFLTAELAKPFDGKTIVVTHFSPHRGTIHPMYGGDKLTPYFCADMSWLMEKHKIDLWIFGHSHTNANFIAEGGCRVLSNQRGYAHEAGINGFREDFVIEFRNGELIVPDKLTPEENLFNRLVSAVNENYDVRGSIIATLVRHCLDHDCTINPVIRFEYREQVNYAVFDFIEMCARSWK